MINNFFVYLPPLITQRSVASNVAANNAAGAGQGTASAISNNAAVTANNNMSSPSSLGLVNNNTSKVSNATSEYQAE